MVAVVMRSLPMTDVPRWGWEVPPKPAQFGSILRDFRERKGWSQDELGERADITQSMVSAYETGRTQEPDPEIVSRIENALGLPIGTLFEMTGNTVLRKRQMQAAPPPGSLVIPPTSPLYDADLPKAMPHLIDFFKRLKERGHSADDIAKALEGADDFMEQTRTRTKKRASDAAS